MAKVGKFLHEISSNVDVNIDNAFGLGKQTDLVVPATLWQPTFSGILESLIIRLKNIAGGATTVTIKITHNTNGTGVVIPDTTATIALEVGSVVAGGVAYSIDLAHVHPDGTFSIFYQLDAGTATVDVIELVWSE